VTHPKSKLVAAVLLASLVSVSGVAAGYNSDDDEEQAARVDALEMEVTKFTKDGYAGVIFEFTPISLPSQRCVTFVYGANVSMQCAPDSGLRKQAQ